MKYLNYIIWTVLVATFTFIFILYAGYLMLYPFVPIVFNELPLKVETKTVRAGESLKFRINYCKKMDAPASVTRQLIGHKDNQKGYSIIQIDLVPVISNVPPSCVDLLTSVIVPSHTAPGRYHLQGSSTYQVNSLREITVKWPTEEFEVVP